MNVPITPADALSRYPELQALVDAQAEGWVFRTITEAGEVVGLAGSRTRQEFTDALFIFDRSNVCGARVLADEYGGGCSWTKEGSDLQEIVDDLLALPQPDAPRAPRLIIRSSLLWTP